MRVKVVNVLSSLQGSLSWDVCDDVTATKGVTNVEYDDAGFCGSKFNNK